MGLEIGAQDGPACEVLERQVRQVGIVQRGDPEFEPMALIRQALSGSRRFGQPLLRDFFRLEDGRLLRLRQDRPGRRSENPLI